MRDAGERDHIAVKKPTSVRTGTHFNADGSPVDNGKRNNYQLEWIDFDAYGDLEAAYVSEVLDDFYELSKVGMQYQPWVHFSEPQFLNRNFWANM